MCRTRRAQGNALERSDLQSLASHKMTLAAGPPSPAKCASMRSRWSEERQRYDAAIDGYLTRCITRRESPRVSEFASLANTDRFHLHRVFRHLYGDTAKNVLAVRHFDRIGRLLLETTATLQEVATIAGFQSRSAFIRQFRRRFGVNPDDFRRDPQGVRAPGTHERIERDRSEQEIRELIARLSAVHASAEDALTALAGVEASGELRTLLSRGGDLLSTTREELRRLVTELSARGALEAR